LVSDLILRDEQRIGDGVSMVTAIAAPLAALIVASGLSRYRELAAKGR
jgi:Zn-dependent protease with chaperone function